MHGIKLHGSFEGRSSRIYDFVAGRLMRGVYRRIAEDIALVAPTNAAVLDIGAGPGTLITEITRLRSDLRITGVDLSADMVRLCQQKGIAAQQADASDLPFAADTFDLVVTSFSLHHWNDVDAAGTEIARVLKPIGRLYVYDFPRAPFADLDAAVRQDAARHTTIRTGRMHMKNCVRHVVPT